MADQVFAVNSGFYDAVNSDRTYSADDMNRPYKRVVSNGVFATPQGTPSTDLKVVPAGTGMEIIVQKGDGIFADKWFENPTALNITVPSNTSTVPRIDSVIVQVDKRTAGRVGNIVYRTGTPSINPAVPAINTVSNVVEYRIANLRVDSGVSAITNGMITDRRGSSDCPWVTSLIYQVDTSTLYDQWASAYEEYFEAEKALWDNWYNHLTEELDISMTLVKHMHTVVTTSETDRIDIGISSYNSNTDLLEVYINGMRAIEGNQYSIDGNTRIILTSPIGIGQTVNFVVLKSVLMGNADNITSILQALEERIGSITGGTPTVVSSVSDMTDTDQIYILSNDSKWYYYDLISSVWTIGGTYGGVPTDKTLTQEGMAADAETVGNLITQINTEILDINTNIDDASEITESEEITTLPAYEWSQGNISSSGVPSSNTDWIYTSEIDVSNYQDYTVILMPTSGYRGLICLYKSDGTVSRRSTVAYPNSDSVSLDGVSSIRFSMSPKPSAAIFPNVGDTTLTTKVYRIVETRSLLGGINNIVDEKIDTASEYYILSPSLSVFPSFGVIGDSYSSGAIHYAGGGYVRRYDLSWVQQMARRNGITGTNYTYSGIGTTAWLTNETYGLPALLADDPKDLYILALGINDYTQIAAGTLQIGSVEDMKSDYTQNPTTFYGNMGKIIGNIKSHAPNAMIVQLSYLRPTGGGKAVMNPAFAEIADHEQIPYVYLDDDGFFTSDFYKITTQVDGHPTAVGYAGMATAIDRLISKSMVENASYFANIGKIS